MYLNQNINQKHIIIYILNETKWNNKSWYACYYYWRNDKKMQQNNFTQIRAFSEGDKYMEKQAEK